ncbi:MAG: S1 RNA-binding domain-containing protein, partial [Chloroflexi bacterium]|nr:S1 RNA-binding domain-containing protein [Chloroflexota bacterium]
MEALLAQSDADTRVGRGDVRTGKVIALGAQGLIIDLGLKRDGIVPPADLDKLAQEGIAFSVGDVVSVTVVEPQDREGNLVVSVHQPRQNQDWVAAEHLLTTGEVWEGPVSGYNRGGLIVPFGELRGFVPASHLTDLPRGVVESERQSRLASLVGKTLVLKVVEVDRARQRLVMSQREAQKEARSRRASHLPENLVEGQTRKGVVSGLRDFGAFVELGGAEGLIHISELSWQRVKHPRDVLKVGQEIEVKVLKIDPNGKRIGLSLKQLQPDPWTHVEERFRVGDWIEGYVTRVTTFGAFVDLGGGVEGLLHSSQMAGGAEIAEGQSIQVRIISVE